MNNSIVIPGNIFLIGLNSILEQINSYSQHGVAAATNQIPHNLLSEQQALAFLNCSLSKIQLLRKAGVIEHIKIGRRVFYSQQALQSFISSQTIKPIQND